MPFDPEFHHRRSIRLRGYDYTQGGAYFVTIASANHAEIFGQVIDGQMQMNARGRIVTEEWLKTAQIRRYVRVQRDEFVVMPNHVHSIIWIVDDVDDAGTGHDAGAGHDAGVGPDAGTGHDAGTYHNVGARRRRAPTGHAIERFGKPVPGSIPTIIRAFKSVTTRRINILRGTPGAPVWQRNYYEHIIRTERALDAIRAYIRMNPQRWEQDSLNPRRGGTGR
jgi:REP element-mobilizing transposase RayT